MRADTLSGWVRLYHKKWKRDSTSAEGDIAAWRAACGGMRHSECRGTAKRGFGSDSISSADQHANAMPSRFADPGSRHLLPALTRPELIPTEVAGPRRGIWGGWTSRVIARVIAIACHAPRSFD